MSAAASSRPLDRVGRSQYGHRISFAAPNASGGKDKVSGILRQIWRENYDNSVPGRCVAIDDDTTGKLTVYGPLPLSFVVSDLGPATVDKDTPQHHAVRPSWVPSRIESITIFWSGGPKDGTSQVITPERMRSRYFSSDPARSEKAEYVWNEKFAPADNRDFTADFWFAGWVTADEAKPAGSAATPLAAGDQYRVQFRNGPLVDDFGRFQTSITGKPLPIITLTPAETGRPLPITYSYTGFGASSSVGFRCSYSLVKP
ncbi:hypothetical protein [Lysinibacter cavernae]|uniref:Uncharacterized protein n=1 Tax=Lysinibacter cavernae TaxID=1640652 RepID=A0A7X5TT42_9MICO|nr:hypothetical protein [Lysinibacter cavernae]NIH53124.1 hypothetical protein [Lysinibacter cavernae]